MAFRCPECFEMNEAFCRRPNCKVNDVVVLSNSLEGKLMEEEDVVIDEVSGVPVGRIYTIPAGSDAIETGDLIRNDVRGLLSRFVARHIPVGGGSVMLLSKCSISYFLHFGDMEWEVSLDAGAGEDSFVASGGLEHILSCIGGGRPFVAGARLVVTVMES